MAIERTVVPGFKVSKARPVGARPDLEPDPISGMFQALHEIGSGPSGHHRTTKTDGKPGRSGFSEAETDPTEDRGRVSGRVGWCGCVPGDRLIYCVNLSFKIVIAHKSLVFQRSVSSFSRTNSLNHQHQVD